MRITGTIIGYDPGGNRRHGLAVLAVKNGSIQEATTKTLDNAEEVIKIAGEQRSLLALGADTLTCWSTGPSGWRPADLWLKRKYREVQKGIVSPNALYGAMALNGMAVILSLRNQQPDLLITETHPKVLFWSLSGEKYDYENKKDQMDRMLATRLRVKISPANDHEWDAAASAFAVLQGLLGIWKHDLLELPTTGGERLVSPCGATHYYWPE